MNFFDKYMSRALSFFPKVKCSERVELMGGFFDGTMMEVQNAPHTITLNVSCDDEPVRTELYTRQDVTNSKGLIVFKLVGSL